MKKVQVLSIPEVQFVASLSLELKDLGILGKMMNAGMERTISTIKDIAEGNR